MKNHYCHKGMAKSWSISQGGGEGWDLELGWKETAGLRRMRVVSRGQEIQPIVGPLGESLLEMIISLGLG